ncbi:LURP-one-related/scramblase family protein [Pseudoduganella namucuonensis]|uniref:Uncharacterized protein YxjI n=1 Tax=Pseudoduganella namucuonensis TaxID=1035707 RepID=A0A1I7M605_9BURK|nr:hypothetical protein [Pseudoduganella namucuonensis]SFV17365.1 Uncharacterized protein YxjI [Pseudoduganella namucuonensis]
MPKTLNIANKLLSLRGRMDISDERGELAYEASGEWGFLSRTWNITRAGTEVARVRRKILSWVPTWLVSGELGDFQVKRKVFSWTRQYYVIGGPLRGAVIKGSLFERRFEIAKGQETIAKATGEIFSLRDRHRIEIYGDNELFTVIVMVVLQLDRRDAAASGD